MIPAFALFLQVQVGQPPRPEPHDGGPVVTALLVRAQRAESEFFIAWRQAWHEGMAANSSELRLLSLHCHADGSWDDRSAPHLITTPFSRRSMCPIWFNVDAQPAPDESVWIDAAIPERDRERIGAARGVLLQLFDSAAAAAPGNGWLTGQRVRLNVDQQQFDRAGAIARNECALAPANCAMLTGFVLESRGDRSGANAAYTYAVTLMSDTERCVYLDIRPFIAKKDRGAYGAIPCQEREPIDERFWWMADPLFTDVWNDRLTIQLYRQTLILLHAALTLDERFDWRLQYGSGATVELILRYGWPSFAYWDSWEENEHFKWLGFSDSSTNSSLEYRLPRYHTTPSYTGASRSLSLDTGRTAPKWNSRRGKWDDDWWPVEHVARATPLIALDYQVATFRRADAALVAIATRPDPELLPDSVLSHYLAKVVAANGPADSARRAVASAQTGIAGAVVMSLATRLGPQVVSAEIVAADSSDRPSGRARVAIIAPPGLSTLRPGEMGLSDPLFFVPSTSEGEKPMLADEAIRRMLGSTTLSPSRIGVFWEIYGLPPSDIVDITLTVSRLDRPGLLHRLIASLGIIGEDGGTIAITWREPRAPDQGGVTYVGGVPVQARAIIVDAGRLRAGRYTVDIAATRPGGAPMHSRKDFQIGR